MGPGRLEAWSQYHGLAVVEMTVGPSAVACASGNRCALRGIAFRRRRPRWRKLRCRSSRIMHTRELPKRSLIGCVFPMWRRTSVHSVCLGTASPSIASCPSHVVRARKCPSRAPRGSTTDTPRPTACPRAPSKRLHMDDRRSLSRSGRSIQWTRPPVSRLPFIARGTAI